MVLNHYTSATFIIGVIILLYTLYYLITYTKINRWIHQTLFRAVNKTVFHSVFFRLLGFTLFGLTTAFIFNVIYDAELDFMTMPIEAPNEVILMTVFLFFLAIIVPYLNVKNSKLHPYPQFKIKKWKKRHMLLSYITWALYIAGYEFMFRGVLLFGTFEEMGYYPAIILNVALYAFVHIPKGRKEVLGCFILGPILCFSALETHSLLIPVILHVTLCLSNEYFSIRREIIKSRKKSARDSIL